MNMQAMLKQAQKLQKDMLKAKEEIDKTEFEGKSSLVTVTMKGTKEIVSVKIDADSIESDEIEMLEDMIQVAVNEASKKVDQVTEQKMGKYTQGMPGLF
ncbi:MAG: YbaB/EbfC family nucleoid-associated protein [Bacilli bacterium]|nr:YbaB/EbfC family nucleoid-associated protein [Bacilli bacterium]